MRILTATMTFATAMAAIGVQVAKCADVIEAGKDNPAYRANLYRPAANASTPSSPATERGICSPEPPAAPRINGAKVFGVRPGRPFLFTIPATGERPMEFAVDSLPGGLNVDPHTGQITGAIRDRGEYIVTFRTKNALGEASRPFKIVCGDTLGLTPPMGWSSWYCWKNRVTDKVMRDAADAMVANRMIDHGYTYVNIDACWQRMPGSTHPMIGGPTRDTEGNILPNKYFPDMKAMTDYIHGKGLKAGIYSAPDAVTCGGGYEGSYEHEAQDVRQYGKWGFDYLKYDTCNSAPAPEPFREMGRILRGLDRDIIYEICTARPDCYRWGREVGGNSWRSNFGNEDIGGALPDSLFRVFTAYSDNQRQEYAGPGGWNDPDTLVLGHIIDKSLGYIPPIDVRTGAVSPSPLTPDEQYTQVSFWSLLAAPLLLGGDIAQLNDFELSLLTNDEVIEVDQDPLGKSALRVDADKNSDVWAKDMSDGSKAVGLFNHGESSAVVTARWSAVGIAGRQIVRDLWQQKDLGAFEDQFSTTVAPHGVVLIRVRSAS